MITTSVNRAGVKFRNLLAIASLICIAAFPLQGHTKATTTGLPDFESLIEKHGKAVVKITVSGKANAVELSPFGQQMPPQFRRYFENIPEQNPQTRAGFGSGFIIADDGYVVTNAHVVDGSDTISVLLPDRREFTAELVGSDERSDIALLKIEATDLPTITLGNSDHIKIGQWVLAIGSPFGFEYTATQGIISAVSRSLPDESYVPFIQTDAAVNPGNSGGPLFDLDGNVIGVNAQIYSRSGGYMGLSFAIPINVVKSVVDQLQQDGYVSRGWLGVAIQGVNQPLAESFGLDRPVGALVSSVTTASPAEKAGLRPGDIILSFNDSDIDRSSDLPPLVGLVRVGEAVDVEILRANKRINLNVTIGELADDMVMNAKGFNDHNNKRSSLLGLAATNLSTEQLNRFDGMGVRVTLVDPSKAAARAGIRENDILLAFNKTAVKSVEQLRNLVKDAPKNTPIAVLLQRDDASLFTALNLE